MWIFLTQNIPEVAFLIYLLYTVIHPTYLLNNGERGWRPLHYCMFYLFRINFSRQEPGQSAVELISQRERLSLEVSATGKVFRIIREITTKSSSTRYIAPQKCLLSFTRGLKWCQTIWMASSHYIWKNVLGSTSSSQSWLQPKQETV